jgi:hypothetical protein
VNNNNNKIKEILDYLEEALRQPQREEFEQGPSSLQPGRSPLRPQPLSQMGLGSNIDGKISGLVESDRLLNQLVDSYINNDIETCDLLWRRHLPGTREPFSADNLNKVLNATVQAAAVLQSNAATPEQQPLISQIEGRLQNYLRQSIERSQSHPALSLQEALRRRQQGTSVLGEESGQLTSSNAPTLTQTAHQRLRSQSPSQNNQGQCYKQ